MVWKHFVSDSHTIILLHNHGAIPFCHYRPSDIPDPTIWATQIMQYRVRDTLPRPRIKQYTFSIRGLQTKGAPSLREKGRDLTQSYDKSPYTNKNVIRAGDNTKNATKSSITQRLRTDLGWSVGVTTATRLVWLTWFPGPTFPLPATAV